ncbi:hypothetical protein [Amycolatopsis sp. cmx-4-61]|uniref:hypothetical protein n=1 Tax=Amycolatopsis sp. cmx-4-61 TaxID=2790937 RepID=UPI00397C52CB
MPSTSGAEDAAPFTVEELLAGMIATTGLDADTVTRWIESMWTPDAIQMRAGVLGGAMDPATGYFRTRAWRAAEFPAANMVADAHPLARMYAATVSDVDGLRLLDPSTVKTMTAVQTDKTTMYGVPADLDIPADRSFNAGCGWRRTASPATSATQAGGRRRPPAQPRNEAIARRRPVAPGCRPRTRRRPAVPRRGWPLPRGCRG